jgi:leader peptidase (prepilin peptidase) / N-methyltransferase
MIGNYVTGALGLAGLLFGSFLNTCASRWPQKESAVGPRSHCRSCGRTLAWWENVPLLSWLALRGRCRTCKAWIGWRYPLVELAVGALWAFTAWQTFRTAPELSYGTFSYNACIALAEGIARLIFLWLLVALAVLDAENLWMPDRLIWPGIGLGLLLVVTRATLDSVLQYDAGFAVWQHLASTAVVFWFLRSVIPVGVLLVIRFVYFWVRGHEGIGMGDVKLMAMLGGWFGILRALLAFVFGVAIGAVVALLLLAIPSQRNDGKAWAQKKLPFGTFLCIGAVACTFWGVPIIALYRLWAGF